MLAFVALKMLTAHWIDIPITLSLAIMGAILGICAVASLIYAGKTAGRAAKSNFEDSAD
jgi:tellurite resistance protein TerC